VSTSRNFVSGNVLTAAQMDDLNQGIIAFATPITSNVGPTSSTTELDVITAPAAVIAQTGRRIRITFYFRSFSGTVLNDTFSFRIKEGATTLSELSQQNNAVSVGQNGCTVIAYVDSPTAASHTYKATIVRSTGTGTATIQAAATFPITLAVEDVGTV
jgi:hypothetical protein